MRTIFFSLLLASVYASAQTSDGPAQLPQRSIEARASFTPSSNYPKFVGPSDSLASAMAAAVPGDTLVVDPANVTLVSTKLTLASGDCANNRWITIKSASSLLPDEFTRVTPAFAALMPKIVINAQNAFVGGGMCVRLIGFEVRRKDGGTIYNLVSGLGHDVILDRVYIHGNAVDETVRGVELSNSWNVAVINSYISDFHCLAAAGTCTDAQAIHGGMSDGTSAGDGNYLIANNYLEGAGENVMFGGGPANVVSADISVLKNDLVKPMRWNQLDPSYVGVNGKDGLPHPWVVKNLFELKNAQRVLLEGNRLVGTWGGFTQVGAMVLVTPKNQGGANGSSVCPLCAVQDVTIRYNYASYGGQALQLACISNANGGWPAACGRISAHDNVFDHLQYANCYQCNSFLVELAGGSASVPYADVSVVNNTFTLDGAWRVPPTAGATQANAMLELGSPVEGNQRMHFDANLFDPGNNGIYSTGGGALNNCFSTGWAIAPLIAKCWPNGSLTGNQFVTTLPLSKARLPWPDGNGVVSAGANQALVDAQAAKRH